MWEEAEAEEEELEEEEEEEEEEEFVEEMKWDGRCEEEDCW